MLPETTWIVVLVVFSGKEQSIKLNCYSIICLTNENNWTLPETIPEPIPEPTPKPTLKKRGVLFLSPEDMQQAKKSMKEKGIKAEDVKNLPPIEEIHGLDNPTQVVKVNSLYRLLSLLAHAWMSLMTLWLSKKTSMLMLVDN